MYIGRGDFASAIEQTKRLTEAAPNDAETWLQLGRLYLQQDVGNDDASKRQAIDAWTTLAAIRPTDASLAMQAAEACLEAATQRSTVDGSSNQIPPAIRENETLLLSNAEKFLNAAIQRDPESPQYREYLAELLQRLERRDEAIETCRQLARNDSPATWHEVARLLERFGYLEEAVDAAARAAEGNDRDLGWRQHYIKLLSKSGQHEQAINQLDRWAKNDTRADWLESAIQLRVDVATAAGSIDQEIERLRRYASSHPDDSCALWTSALMLSAAGQPIEAAEAMGRAVKRNTDNSSMIRQYASLLEIANRPNLAVEQYRRLLNLDPSRQRDDYQRIVDLELRLNHLQAAQEAALQLVQAAPTDPESHLLKATVAMRRGDLETRLAALSCAVKVAPRDLQMRRQYATALRESRQTQAALDEAFACFELAQSLSERRSILSWTLDWASGLPERKWLLDKVQQNRQQQSDIYNSTLCLVHLLDRMNRQADALRELTDLQRQFPTDVDLLAELVRLAEATNQSDAAVKHQEQLARLSKSPAALEQLARLYRQNGQLNDAARIWDDLLTSNPSFDQTVEMVDRMLSQADLYQAQRFAEAGLAQFPDNWQLAYRSGLIHLAMSQPAAARNSLALVLRTQPEREAVSGNTPAEYRVLDKALHASELFRAIGYRIERHGARNPKTLRQFFDNDILKVGGSGSLADTRIYAAVALLTLAQADNEPAEWIAELIADPDASGPQLQLATAATWVSFRGGECRQSMERLRARLPQNALPSLICILNPPYWDLEDGISVPGLQAEYEWLQAHRSRLARDLQPLYVARLFYHRDGEGVAALTKQSIDAATQFSDATCLMPLVRRAQDPDLQMAFFSAIDRLLPRTALRVDKDRVWATLTFCLGIANWDQPQPSKVTLDLFELMLSRSRLSVLTRQTGVFQLATDPYAKLVRRLTKDASFVISQRSQTRRTSQPVEVRERRQQRFDASLQQQRILESHNAGSFRIGNETIDLSPPAVAGRSEPKWFPTPTADLDRVRLEVIKDITMRMKAAQQLTLLADRLKQGESTSDRRDQRVFQLAQIVSDWHAEQQDSAVDHLSRLANERSGEADLPLLLVRANLQRRHLPAALATLNLIPTRDDEWRFLRRSIAADWSDQALVRDLEGHTGAIASIAYSVDGRKLASASIDQTVRIWDVSSGKLEHTLSDHDDIVLAVAYSPSGNLLASAGYDRTVRLWDAETLQSLGSLNEHTSTIRALAFSPDGSKLATAGDDRVVLLWDLETKTKSGEFAGHVASVTTLAFSANGDQVASSSSDGTTIVWNSNDGKQTATLSANDGSIRSLVYAASNDHLISGSDERVIRLWQRDSQAWTSQTIQTNAGVRGVSYHSASQRLASGLDDNSVVVWKPDSATEQLVLRGHTGRVLTVSFAPDGKSMASAGFDGTIKIWNTNLPAE